MIKIKSDNNCNVTITTHQTDENNLKTEMMAIFRNIISYTRVFAPDLFDKFIKVFKEEVEKKYECSGTSNQ